MEASPTKRRVLGSLDANASPRPRMAGKQQDSSYPLKPTSPVKRLAVFSCASEPSPKKRMLTAEGTHALGLQHLAEKVCLEGGREPRPIDQENQITQFSSTRQQSVSPEPSSIFDTSAIDTSQTTTISEDDIIAPSAAVSALSTLSMPRLPTRPRLTREQAREKAEILRLRLGLASYKLRTGQTDVPLETLERKRAASQAARSRNAADWAASSRLQMQASAALAGVHRDAAASGSRVPTPPSMRRPLPGAPVRRQSGDSTTSQRSTSSNEREETTHDGESAHRRRESETRLVGQTPRRLLRFEVDVDEEGSASRGGAASGLLSLARS